jgi:hypothetical protein
MPNWAAIAKSLGQYQARHPIISTVGRMGAGGALGYAVSGDTPEQKQRGIMLGAGAGALSGLAHKSMREALLINPCVKP